MDEVEEQMTKDTMEEALAILRGYKLEAEPSRNGKTIVVQVGNGKEFEYSITSGMWSQVGRKGLYKSKTLRQFVENYVLISNTRKKGLSKARRDEIDEEYGWGRHKTDPRNPKGL